MLTNFLNIILIVIFFVSCNYRSSDEKMRSNRIFLDSIKSGKITSVNRRLDDTSMQAGNGLLDSIPKYVQGAIEAKLPKWHVVNLTYYDSSWKSFYDDKTNLPYIVTGRLNENMLFFAVILMNDQNDIGVFALNFVGDSFKSVHELEVLPAFGSSKSEMLPIDIGLYSEEVNEYRDGIIINNFERVSTLYVWNGVGYVKKDADQD